MYLFNPFPEIKVPLSSSSRSQVLYVQQSFGFSYSELLVCITSGVNGCRVTHQEQQEHQDQQQQAHFSEGEQSHEEGCTSVPTRTDTFSDFTSYTCLPINIQTSQAQPPIRFCILESSTFTYLHVSQRCVCGSGSCVQGQTARGQTSVKVQHGAPKFCSYMLFPYGL